MRQTSALPARITAKSLENQLSAFIHSLSAFFFQEPTTWLPAGKRAESR
jgi:hypothetical protein